ncbi:MAG: hypothetical protein WBA90_16235 [Albidovulum sp.]
MSAMVSTENLQTNPDAPMGAAIRGAVLLVLGVLFGYGIGADKTDFMADLPASSTAAATNDWHGNVMQSGWSN